MRNRNKNHERLWRGLLSQRRKPRSRVGGECRPTGDQEGPHSLVCAGRLSFGSGWRCGSYRGSVRTYTSSKDSRELPGGRSLRTRIPSSSIAGACAGIRRPSHNRGNVRSLLTFFLVLLPYRPANRWKLEDKRSDSKTAGRDGQIPKPARSEHAWARGAFTLEQSRALGNGPKVRGTWPNSGNRA